MRDLSLRGYCRKNVLLPAKKKRFFPSVEKTRQILLVGKSSFAQDIQAFRSFFRDGYLTSVSLL